MTAPSPPAPLPTLASPPASRPDPRAYTPGLDPLDRLYDLLPAHVRARDLAVGQPLRALARVLAETLLVVEADIARLYENWFIETCDPWAVPYVAAPVGYTPLPAPTLDGAGVLDGPRGRRRLGLLAPRRDAADTLDRRRRKGTAAVFQTLASDIAGWPARAVELRDRTAVFQHVNHLRPERGRLIDVRNGDAIDRGFGPFSTLARTLDVRLAVPDTRGGRGRNGDLALYVWPLEVLKVEKAPTFPLPESLGPPRCRHGERRHDYTFSALGNETPLYRRADPPPAPDRIADEREVPGRLRLRSLRDDPAGAAGPHQSLRLWTRQGEGPLVPVDDFIAADLTCSVALKPGQVAADPEHGLISTVVRDAQARPEFWASYRYAAPGPLGGGSYPRLPVGEDEDGPAVNAPDCQPAPAPRRVFVSTTYPTVAGLPAPTTTDDTDTFRCIDDAIRWWTGLGEIRPKSLVVEVLDDEAYGLDGFGVGPAYRVEIRAGRGRRPLILSDGASPFLGPVGAPAGGGGVLVFDGLLFAGAPLYLTGPFASVAFRHCTLVPGLMLRPDGTPSKSDSPSLILNAPRGTLTIDRSIVGPVCVETPRDPDRPAGRAGTPPRLVVRDSILDYAGGCCPAIGGNGGACRPYAFLRLRAERVTVFGPVSVHAIELAQDSLFTGTVRVARRRQGCMRFCYTPPPPRSTTPARYRCQPDLAAAGPTGLALCPPMSGMPLPRPPDPGEAERRVRPRFRSTRYGDPDYALLAPDAPPELTAGAEDLAEMGAFHDDSISLRRANLRSRADEFAPVGAGVQILEVFD